LRRRSEAAGLKVARLAGLRTAVVLALRRWEIMLHMAFSPALDGWRTSGEAAGAGAASLSEGRR
jgi:hypothetical protein